MDLLFEPVGEALHLVLLRRIVDGEENFAEAQARFRLGTWLRSHGKEAEGDRQMAEASRLHPDAWSMWRQAADAWSAAI